MKAKKEALHKYIDWEDLELEEIEAIEATKITYGEGVGSSYFEVAGTSNEYLVLTDEEADKEAKRRIKESLWAFRSDFIISHSKTLKNEDGVISAIESIQEQLHEDANPIIEALIDDLDKFVEDAIGTDGRGHFLNPYNGGEAEIKVGNKYFYIYRVN